MKMNKIFTIILLANISLYSGVDPGKNYSFGDVGNALIFILIFASITFVLGQIGSFFKK